MTARDAVGLDQLGKRCAGALARRRAQRLDGRRRPDTAGKQSVPERNRVAFHTMADGNRLDRYVLLAGAVQQRPRLRVGETERVGPRLERLELLGPAHHRL